MLRAFTTEVPVWLLVHPSIDLEALKNRLGESGVNIQRIHFETGIEYDDTWTRDYGPLSRNTGYVEFGFNGWGGKYSAPHDNAVPSQLTHLLGEQPVDAGFVCEGGGLETNGEILLVNRDCIVDELRNPGVPESVIAEQLKYWLGVADIEWLSNIQLTGDDTDGHIDTIARFVSENQVIYAGRNAVHPDAESLFSLHEQLTGIAERRNWQLFELPSPEVRSLLDNRVLPATYANFLLCNDKVFVPVYGVAEDEGALAVIARACPGRQVLPVRCEALLEQHGSLHCATMQIIDLTKMKAG